MKKQSGKDKKELVANSDLGIPYTTVANRWIVNTARSLLGINKLNALYGAVDDLEGLDFVSGVLRELDAKIEISKEALRNIPEKGAFVLISNYPHGALDGLLLMDTVLRKRPDAKFLGNFILSKIDSIKNFFVELDPSETKEKSNYSGTRRAIEYLRGGSPLIIFPSGEISTYHGMPPRMQDGPWSGSMMRFIRKLGVPVVPAFIAGRNSMKFHVAGKMASSFRTLRMPLELLNKKGYTTRIEIGSPLTSEILASINSVKAYSDYLRLNVYCLGARLLSSAADAVKGDARSGGAARERLSVSDEILVEEIAGFKGKVLLGKEGDSEIFYIPSQRVPELPKTAEALLAAAPAKDGKDREGAKDENKGNNLYGLLAVWDSDKGSLTAVFRVVEGDKLLNNEGMEGFSAYDDFEFSPKLNPVFRQSIEAEMLFSAEGDLRPDFFVFLRKGLWQVFEKDSGYRYVISEASIPRDYFFSSKWLLINYLKQFFMDKELAGRVVSRRAMPHAGKISLDKELLKSISSFDLIDKLICDIDPAYDGMPCGLKEALSAGGKILGFAQGKEANASLNVLILADIEASDQKGIGEE